MACLYVALTIEEDCYTQALSDGFGRLRPVWRSKVKPHPGARCLSLIAFGRISSFLDPLHVSSYLSPFQLDTDSAGSAKQAGAVRHLGLRIAGIDLTFRA
ncbi:hypothetical protein MHYP_G00014040 [Metynnis hypsauchen]